MSEETIRGYATNATYMQPDGEEPRIKVRICRRARKGSKVQYGSNYFELEITLPPYTARDLVQSIRNGMTKVRENKANDLRAAESWMDEIRKAATP